MTELTSQQPADGVKVKICGLRTQEALETAIEAGATYIGLVHFPKSPRHVSLEEAGRLAALAHGRVKVVLLLVNPDDALIDAARTAVAFDMLQLHGDESPQRVAEIRSRTGRPVIKALKIGTADDLSAAASYESAADLLLFDARPPKDSNLPGGNGVPFDWELLSGFNGGAGFMLSGGLDPDNVAAAIAATNAALVDVSSGVERAPGDKDLDKIRRFIKTAQQRP
jgi:phosphoribosylanthranilate isomerase